MDLACSMMENTAKFTVHISARLSSMAESGFPQCQICWSEGKRSRVSFQPLAIVSQWITKSTQNVVGGGFPHRTMQQADNCTGTFKSKAGSCPILAPSIHLGGMEMDAGGGVEDCVLYPCPSSPSIQSSICRRVDTQALKCM